MVELVNNHVLFANEADWTVRPQWQRAWKTAVVDALTKAQSRFGLRSNPRASLQFTITPVSQQEQARFDDCIRAAKKSGLACAPMHGRGALLTADASGDEITTNEGWPWAIGDYCFFRFGDTYEVRQLT